MNFELKKIDFFSAIKISFLINAVIGLLVGLFIGLILMLFIGLAQNLIPYDQMDMGGPDLGALGMFGGIFIGLFYAVIIAVGFGIIVTGIIVLLYNLFAGWLGGVKFKLEGSALEVIAQPKPAQPPMLNTQGDVTNV
jgi:predicted membrane-bound spermidine synthase